MNQIDKIQNELNRLQAELDKLKQPDYTHLLPEGYEFCEEEQAEDWVKVELDPNYKAEHQSPLGHLWTGIMDEILKPLYRPIRPIQYRVAVHEVVTAIAEAQKVAGLYQPLFDLLHREHNVIATESEIEEIIRVVRGLKLDPAEPNPYAVDWTNAPEWADVHCFDRDGSGWWYGAKLKNSFWHTDDCDRSGFTIPSGLDWKQSKTRRP